MTTIVEESIVPKKRDRNYRPNAIDIPVDKLKELVLTKKQMLQICKGDDREQTLEQNIPRMKSKRTWSDEEKALITERLTAGRIKAKERKEELKRLEEEDAKKLLPVVEKVSIKIAPSQNDNKKLTIQLKEKPKVVVPDVVPKTTEPVIDVVPRTTEPVVEREKRREKRIQKEKEEKQITPTDTEETEPEVRIIRKRIQKRTKVIDALEDEMKRLTTTNLNPYELQLLKRGF